MLRFGSLLRHAARRGVSVSSIANSALAESYGPLLLLYFVNTFFFLTCLRHSRIISGFNKDLTANLWEGSGGQIVRRQGAQREEMRGEGFTSRPGRRRMDQSREEDQHGRTQARISRNLVVRRLPSWSLSLKILTSLCVTGMSKIVLL